MILDNEFFGDMRVENELSSLINSGVDASIICFDHGNDKRSDSFEEKRIIRLELPLWWKKKLKPFINTPFDLYSRIWSRKIKKVVEERGIEVLHVHDLYMLPAAFIAKRQLKRNLTIVADLHENYPHALKNYKYANTFPGNMIISIPKWERSEIKMLDKCDHVITVIEEASLRYENLGVINSKISVVPNYVNLESFETSTKPKIKGIEDKFMVLYTGGFDTHRGLEHVVNAVPLILEHIPNFCLVLVGTGKNENDLKELAAKHKVEEQVYFEGWQLPGELASYMNESDICIIPHLKTVHTDNTIPHKLFHYMYMKRPVIVTNCDPLKRIVDECEAGLIYKSNDSEDFKDKVVQLYSSKEKRTEMALNGYRAVQEKYNWKAASKSLTSLYNNL